MTQNCSAFWGWASWKVARQVLSFIRTSWALVDQLPNWSVLCSTKWPVSLFEIYWNLLSDSNGMLKWETDGEDVFYELTPETKQITSHVFKSVLKASKFDYPLECMLVHIWLVVYLPLWKIIEFVSWDDDIPNMMGKIIQSCSKPPTRCLLLFQLLTIINHRLTI